MISAKSLFTFLLVSVLTVQVTLATEKLAKEDSLSEILDAECRFSGEFTQQKSVQGLPIKLNSNGQMIFDCELGLIWHTQTPVVETKIYSQQEIHFGIDKFSDLELLDDVIETKIAGLILDIMNANAEQLNSKFTVTQTSEFSVQLQPNDSFLKKGIRHVNLTRTAEDEALIIELVDAKSQTTVINAKRQSFYKNSAETLTACKSLMDKELSCLVLEKPEYYQRYSLEN